MFSEDLPGWLLPVVLGAVGVWMAVEDDCRRWKKWMKDLGVGQ